MWRYPQIKIQTAKSTALYQDSDTKILIQYLFAQRELCFYGTIKNQSEYVYFVEYNGNLGYVKESDVSPFTIPNHPNPLSFIPEETPPPIEEPTTSNDSVDTLRIIIIASLIFAGLSGLVVVIKKRPSVPVNTYYDENDYE